MKEIEERCNAATAGPWKVSCGGFAVRFESNDSCVGYGVCELTGRKNLNKMQADADFIAHARTDVDALLAEAKRLQGELDAAVEVIDKIQLILPDFHIGGRNVRDQVNEIVEEWRTAQEGINGQG